MVVMGYIKRQVCWRKQLSKPPYGGSSCLYTQLFVEYWETYTRLAMAGLVWCGFEIRPANADNIGLVSRSDQLITNFFDYTGNKPVWTGWLIVWCGKATFSGQAGLRGRPKAWKWQSGKALTNARLGRRVVDCTHKGGGNILGSKVPHLAARFFHWSFPWKNICPLDSNVFFLDGRRFQGSWRARKRRPKG